MAEVDLKCQTQDMREHIYFLALENAHAFVICTGLSQWPRSDALTFGTEREIPAQWITRFYLHPIYPK